MGLPAAVGVRRVRSPREKGFPGTSFLFWVKMCHFLAYALRVCVCMQPGGYSFGSAYARGGGVSQVRNLRWRTSR
jgi:hypothetical protein